MSNGEKKQESTTTTTTKPAGWMETVWNTVMPGSAKKRRQQNIEAESYGDDSGNPCHYGTHMGDKKGMNRQGRRKTSRSCHHGR